MSVRVTALSVSQTTQRPAMGKDTEVAVPYLKHSPGITKSDW
jgi:hypothetical protein